MKKNILVLIFGLVILTITWCSKNNLTPINEDQALQEQEKKQRQINMSDKNHVIDFAIKALKEKNIEQLKKVTSKEGIRFSPYNYVDVDKHIVLKKDDLIQAFNSEINYVRWWEDGTWDPIIMTFKNYLKRYIYDLDFETLWERNYDQILQRGNTINNIDDIYSGASTVEFFIPGLNPEYWWMDRKSLTLILIQEDNERKIKWITHGERTI